MVAEVGWKKVLFRYHIHVHMLVTVAALSPLLLTSHTVLLILYYLLIIVWKQCHKLIGGPYDHLSK